MYNDIKGENDEKKYRQYLKYINHKTYMIKHWTQLCTTNIHMHNII